MHKPSIYFAIREFLADRRSLRRKPRTIQFYRGNLDRFAASIEEAPGISVKKALKRGKIRRFFASLDDRGVSQDTFAAYDRVLRTFCHFCLQEGWINANPMDNRPRLRQDRNKLPDTFNIAEVDRLLATCDQGDVGVRDRAIMLLLLDTGMRAGEMCGLTADRLECAAGGGRIEIPALLSKGAEDRVVMFCDVTADALGDWLFRRGPPDPGGWVFLAVSGRRTLSTRPLTPGGLNQMIHRRCEAAGVEGHSHLCHIWRHTFAKMYVQGGGDLESLRRLLGHASLDTVRIYLRFKTDELEDMHRQRSPVHRLALVGEQKTPVTFVTGV
jgi:site-specific recombinase XerD